MQNSEQAQLDKTAGRMAELLTEVFENQWSWCWRVKRKSVNGDTTHIDAALTPAGLVMFHNYGRDGFELFLPVPGNSIDKCVEALKERIE